VSGNAALLIIDVQTAFFLEELSVQAYNGKEYLARMMT
jgi:hypothetical protein